MPEDWSLAGADEPTPPSAHSTTPPDCSFHTLFPAKGRQRAILPSHSVMRVQVLRSSGGLQTIRSWAGRCSSFTALGGGGTTGKNWLWITPADESAPDAIGYWVSGQSPFVPEELELAGTVRGALILVSQVDPDDGDTSAADVYRAIAAKINDWRG